MKSSGSARCMLSNTLFGHVQPPLLRRLCRLSGLLAVSSQTRKMGGDVEQVDPLFQFTPGKKLCLCILSHVTCRNISSHRSPLMGNHMR